LDFRGHTYGDINLEKSGTGSGGVGVGGGSEDASFYAVASASRRSRRQDGHTPTPHSYWMRNRSWLEKRRVG
jgi:hypothetical protein